MALRKFYDDRTDSQSGGPLSKPLNPKPEAMKRSNHKAESPKAQKSHGPLTLYLDPEYPTSLKTHHNKGP